MNEYTPDRWVMIKITSDKLFKDLGSIFKNYERIEAVDGNTLSIQDNNNLTLKCIFLTVSKESTSSISSCQSSIRLSRDLSLKKLNLSVFSTYFSYLFIALGTTLILTGIGNWKLGIGLLLVA